MRGCNGGGGVFRYGNRWMIEVYGGEERECGWGKEAGGGGRRE